MTILINTLIFLILPLAVGLGIVIASGGVK